MMVIRGTIGTAVNGIWPADRCSWVQSYEEGQTEYRIGSAVFYPGADTIIAGATTSAAHGITNNPQLGFIGKSGRFVAIAK